MVDVKIYANSLLGCSGSTSAFDRATHGLQCISVGAHQLISHLLDLFGFVSSVLFHSFSKTSMACNTMKACGCVHQMDNVCRIAEFPNDKKEKAPRFRSVTRFKKRDFISIHIFPEHGICQQTHIHGKSFLSHVMCITAQVSRFGLAVGLRHVLLEACARHTDSIVTTVCASTLKKSSLKVSSLEL